MKLHVNRPNTKKARKQAEDRKKKEQESAEAISGLKIRLWLVENSYCELCLI